MRQVSLLHLKPTSILSSDQQLSHILKILEIVDSDLTSLFTSLDGCTELPSCCHEFVLLVVGILVLLLRNLGVVVEVIGSFAAFSGSTQF